MNKKMCVMEEMLQGGSGRNWRKKVTEKESYSVRGTMVQSAHTGGMWEPVSRKVKEGKQGYVVEAMNVAMRNQSSVYQTKG